MMSLRDFIELALHQDFECYIFDNNTNEVVFKGNLDKIPEEFLDRDFSSWELEPSLAFTIGLNID